MNFSESHETIYGTSSNAPRIGFDLVRISEIASSIEQFGNRFTHRLFTPSELAYANSGADLSAERLAARFAAKEATIKALKLSNTGIGWREIEVFKSEDGDCEVVLHGHSLDLACALGVKKILLSLSHDGDYAGAMVTVLFN